MKNPKHTIELARQLRKNMTKEEKHLWYDYLSAYPIRFQKQKPFGKYILDFYCPKAKLVIEIDGSQHYKDGAREYDAIRTKFLEENNLIVIRFTNIQIHDNFGGVCRFIDSVVKERIDIFINPTTASGPPPLSKAGK